MSVLSPGDRLIVGDPMETSVRVRPGFRVVAPDPVSGALVSGRHGSCVLRPGLRLHFSDAVDLCDLVVRNELEPGLTVTVLLELGTDVRASLGGQSLIPEGGVSKNRPMVVVTAHPSAELFERRGRDGGRVRKVSLMLSREWLADSGLDHNGADFHVRRFAGTHMAQQAWAAGSTLAHLAEGILRTPSGIDPLQALRLESRAVELVAETFAALMQRPRRDSGGSPASRDLRRLERVEDYLAASDAASVPLDELARVAGISVSTLQRLFQSVHGMSAFEFIRRRNLERARAALLHRGVSVKEAAYLAGYSSPANFSTAFRHHFGQPPKRFGRTRAGVTSPA
jgi:AraC-type DNA-binding domain-containing proteins